MSFEMSGPVGGVAPPTIPGSDPLSGGEPATSWRRRSTATPPDPTNGVAS